MIVLGRAAVFGQSESPAPLTALEQVQVPSYVNTLQALKAAEEALYAAYANIYSYRQAGGDAISIPTSLLQTYNTARANLIEAATKWTDLRSKVAREDLPDPDAQIKYPPAFLLDTGVGLSGFDGSLPAAVPASRVMVAYDGQRLPLGAAQAPLIDGAGFLGLGFEPVTFVIVILGLTLIGLVIAYAIREWNRGEVEQNRTLALQTKEQTAQVEKVSAKLVELQTNCIRGSTDPKIRVSCTEATQKAMADAIGALPKPPGVESRRLTNLLMLAAITVAVSVGGYAFWRKQQRTKQAASESNEAEMETEMEAETAPPARLPRAWARPARRAKRVSRGI